MLIKGIRRDTCQSSHALQSNIVCSTISTSWRNEASHSNRNSTNLNLKRLIYSDNTIQFNVGQSDFDIIRICSDELKEKLLSGMLRHMRADNYQLSIETDMYKVILLSYDEKHLDVIEKVAANLKDSTSFEQGRKGWGSALMRKYMTLGLIDRGYKNIMDVKTYGSFFHGYNSYRVAMTMLYRAGRYKEVLEIFDLATSRCKTQPMVTDRQLDFEAGLAIVVFASLAKIKTPEALNQAEQLYIRYIKEGLSEKYTLKRMLSFLAYTAIQVGEPAKAINWTKKNDYQKFADVRNLQTVAWLKLKRYEQLLFHMLSRYTNVPDEAKKGRKIPREICDMIEECQDEMDESIWHDMLKLLLEMDQQDLITDRSLEQLIFHEIAYFLPQPIYLSSPSKNKQDASPSDG